MKLNFKFCERLVRRFETFTDSLNILKWILINFLNLSKTNTQSHIARVLRVGYLILFIYFVLLFKQSVNPTTV